MAEESRLAGLIKKQVPLWVIIGNPPYSGHSSNTGAWIRNLIDSYKQLDGQPLGERNSKWLQDDYVKFLRLAQWKVEQTGRGMVAMITNHAYLDNPTFRGMRCSFLQSFDAIYILDLHGNALKKETAPDGGVDKNVFDIRAGVAIVLLVKRGGGEVKATAKVWHAELWGSRAVKYEWLATHDWQNTPWQVLQPQAPFYLLVPHDDAMGAAYRSYPSIPELMPVNSVGILTAQDEFAISWTAAEAKQKVQALLQTHDEAEARAIWRLCSQGQWNYTRAKKALHAGGWQDEIVPIYYRPFDMRWTVFNGNVVISRRERVMRHIMTAANLALVIMRQVSLNESYTHAIVTNTIVDNRAFFSSKGTTTVIPLYIYSSDRQDILNSNIASTRHPNFNPTILTALTTAYGTTPTPEAIFHYLYAILYTPSYRHKYAAFLRLDFPRIPFPTQATLFHHCAALGQRLTALHLLTATALDPPLCRFEGQGTNHIHKGKTGLRYDSTTGQVWINAHQYFAPVPETIWNYHIGGYQVCDKWLKDRRERQLTITDIRTYCHIVTALHHTISIQEELEQVYPTLETSVIVL